MPQITVPIKVGSPEHQWLEHAAERFGDNYHHKLDGKYYRIVDWTPTERGSFNLILEAAI